MALPEAAYPATVGRRSGFDWTLNQQDDPQLRARATRLLVRSLPATAAEIRKRYAVDRVYLLGFSQGALAAMLAGLFDGSAFDGVVTFGLPAFDPGWIALDTAAPATRLRTSRSREATSSPRAGSKRSHGGSGGARHRTRREEGRRPAPWTHDPGARDLPRVRSAQAAAGDRQLRLT